MMEERVQYGIDNFLEEDFFLPPDGSYFLEEKSESGKSELQVDIKGDNLCSEDYDRKGKCNFLRDRSRFKLKRSVDIGETVRFKHIAVKMQRTEDGAKLIGKLRI